MLRFDINFVFTIINVLVLFVVVKLFLIKPVKKILAARQEEVEGEYTKAEDAKAKAEELQAQYEKSLSEAAEEKASIISEAHTQANRDYEKIVADAKTEADTILKNAQINADEQRVRNMLQAKGEIAGMVAEAAAKIVTGSDNPQNDSQLYDRFLEKAGVRRKGQRG